MAPELALELLGPTPDGEPPGAEGSESDGNRVEQQLDYRQAWLALPAVDAWRKAHAGAPAAAASPAAAAAAPAAASTGAGGSGSGRRTSAGDGAPTGARHRRGGRGGGSGAGASAGAAGGAGSRGGGGIGGRGRGRGGGRGGNGGRGGRASAAAAAACDAAAIAPTAAAAAAAVDGRSAGLQEAQTNADEAKAHLTDSLRRVQHALHDAHMAVFPGRTSIAESVGPKLPAVAAMLVACNKWLDRAEEYRDYPERVRACTAATPSGPCRRIVRSQRYALHRLLVTRRLPACSQTVPETFRPDLVDVHGPTLRTLLGPLSAAAERHEAARTFLTQQKTLDKVAAGRAAAIGKAQEAAQGQGATGTGNKRGRTLPPGVKMPRNKKHAGGAGN